MSPVAERIAHSTRAARLLNAVGLPRGALNQTIVVAGSPRSGTTWLAELLAALRGYTLVNEPLHLRWRAVEEAGFEEWRTYIGKEETRSAARAYLRRALAGRAACTRQFNSEHTLGKLREFLWGRRHVVKFVRANRMLHWIHDQFPIREMVLILRHPCAVVASQLDYKHEGWRRTTPPTEDELQTDSGGWIPDDVLYQFKSALARVETTAGRLAAVWGLDTYFPLCEHESFLGIVTTYERLLSREREEVSRIFEALDESVPPSALQAYDRASNSAAPDLATRDERRQLSKWKRKLEADQVDEILSIVKGFGLDFYSEALEPDYKRLSACIENRKT